jgi:hypothetical protein
MLVQSQFSSKKEVMFANNPFVALLRFLIVQLAMMHRSKDILRKLSCEGQQRKIKYTMAIVVIHERECSLYMNER